MRENIDIIVVYNLLDSNGTKLQLRLGRLKGYGDGLFAYHTDQGFRWSFAGSKIPMPIRAYTWFNGFPEKTMLDWLKGNGWALRSRVEMSTGKATVYELPVVDEPNKGNESTAPATSAQPCEFYKSVFDDVLRSLVTERKRITAVRVYRYAHGGTLGEATDAVKEICKDIWC